jgi:hypothetical protein
MHFMDRLIPPPADEVQHSSELGQAIAVDDNLPTTMAETRVQHVDARKQPAPNRYPVLTK